MKRVMFVLCGLICANAQAGDRKAAVVQVSVAQETVVGLQFVSETLPDKEGRQVLTIQMDVGGVAYPIYFVKDSGQEYEPNITSGMVGKMYGVAPTPEDALAFKNAGGNLDIFTIEALNVVHDAVSIQFLDERAMIIYLWNGGAMVGAFLSADRALILEAEAVSIDDDAQEEDPLPLTQSQKKAAACGVLYHLCTGPPTQQQAQACIGWLQFCQ